MKKQLVIIGITLLLLAVVLSGCNQVSNPQKSDKDKFVGTWIENTNSTPKSRITFFFDGTFVNPAASGTWELKDGKLVMVTIAEGQIETNVCDYTFSNNDNTMTLTDKYGTIQSFTKS
jgi:hypothetical protein